MPTSSSFKRGNIDIRGGFRVSGPSRAPHRPLPLPLLVKQTGTRWGPRVQRDVRTWSKIREKLIRRGPTSQDVANAAALTRTENNYRLEPLFTVKSDLMADAFAEQGSLRERFR
jgi:hypothetical protein